MTQAIRSHPAVTVVEGEVERIPEEGQVIVAAGPLASDALTEEISRLFPDSRYLNFFDAAAPLVTFESVNMERAWFASRYDRGTPDYINCPMEEEEYQAFWEALTTAQEAEVHGFEDSGVFEGCMPVEVMARRGRDTLCYGPLKPVGLKDPRTGREPFAVVQLRRDNAQGSIYNIVGFQTHLKWPEQKRVFSMIPGLERAEFVRYGVMHRNTFLDSPRLLNRYFRVRTEPRIRFAGQVTGVEGYVESTASGCLAALELARDGIIPAGAYRNLEFAGPEVETAGTFPQAVLDCLYDPQTSGGLLLAIAEERGAELLRRLADAGVTAAAVGRVRPRGPRRIVLKP